MILRKKISKFLSFILRHAASKYDLKLDRYGFADLDKVLIVLKEKFPFLGRKDLEEIAKNDPKLRFEIKENKIRARYGHSIKVEPKEKCKDVPTFLFHGTSFKNLNSILKEGLTPQRRVFVHLSSTLEDAYMVGKRKSSKLVILRIEAKKATKEISFWKEGKVYLAKRIPPQYIHVLDN
jgi:putative RNA 2'-phosphotransferase